MPAAKKSRPVFYKDSAVVKQELIILGGKIFTFFCFCYSLSLCFAVFL
ncbi:hypothetical protein HMPREF0454_01340 [Hafnia alvei ATCC 51873]|uniref:Uncharacterized protein n=1 Tax=Hafnia alvei ATCC 51873 TaxID=1002364 RepID=G9Y459_HAFAL|nr:hypothetical protein HMPREF0454_01340 [Hafnia alvei ATCC 51873]